jgi:hypothetical protein
MAPPVRLDNRKPPDLPDDIFAGWLGDMINAVSLATETPRELSAMAVLGILGTVCQKRFAIRPEPGYFESLAIWAVCALLPGNRKSAVMSELVRPLIAWERRKTTEVGEERKRIESKRKTAEARIAELRSSAKKKNGAEFHDAMEAIADEEAAVPELPELPRLFAQDVTPERLGSLLAENGERMGIISDEGGPIDMMKGRYSNNGVLNLDVFLQGHAGSSVRVDRGSRGPVVLNHPALSMALSPQPDVLAGLTSHPGFRGRGLLARWLFAIPVSRLGYRNLEPHPIPGGIRDYYNRSIEALADIPANMMNGEEVSRILYPTADAWRVWKEWQREVELMMRSGGRLENLTDWAGKLPGATARIAGLLHCADYATCAESVLEVQAETMERAVRFARFLLEHALIAFDVMGADPGMEVAQRLWSVIEANRSDTFSANDAWHPLRGTYKRAKDAEPGFEVLIEHSYIEELHTADLRKPGRPSRRFRVNPLIVEMWK